MAREFTTIVLHIDANRTAEFEALFEQEELKRWDDYTRRGRFIEARLIKCEVSTLQETGIQDYVLHIVRPDGLKASPSTCRQGRRRRPRGTTRTTTAGPTSSVSDGSLDCCSSCSSCGSSSGSRSGARGWDAGGARVAGRATAAEFRRRST